MHYFPQQSNVDIMHITDSHYFFHNVFLSQSQFPTAGIVIRMIELGREVEAQSNFPINLGKNLLKVED